MNPPQLVGCLLVIIGLGAWVYIAYLRMKVKKSMSWPSTQGEIIQSEVVLTGCGSGNVNSSPGHSAIILYQYQVRGKRYESNNFTIGGNVSSGSEQKEEEKVHQYPVGTAVDVYYNPENPEDVCLERTEKITNVALMINMIILVGLLMASGIFS